MLPASAKRTGLRRTSLEAEDMLGSFLSSSLLEAEREILFASERVFCWFILWTMKSHS